MKRNMAALFAALLILSACSAKTETETITQEETTAQTEVSSEPAESETIEFTAAPATEAEEPETSGEENPSSQTASWFDEPQTEQFDLEEVVSCTYTMPHFTFETEEASKTANAIFEVLGQDLRDYAQDSVYPAAQEKQAIGFLNGGYSAGESENTLVVTYTISVSFSTETQDQQFTHSYTIDLITGELLKEE